VRAARDHAHAHGAARHDGARRREHRGAARPQPEGGGQQQGAHQDQRRGATGVPAGEREGVVAADGPVDDGLPERGDQPGQSGTADGEHRRPRGAGHEADHGEQACGDGDNRRRTEHGDGPDEPVPRRRQRVDRAVQVAVDPTGGVVARVAHGEDGHDRRREHRHRRRGPAGPVGEQRAVGEGHQPDGTENAQSPMTAQNATPLTHLWGL